MIDNFINTLHAPIQLIPRNRSRNNLRFKRAPRVFFFTLQSISDNLSRGRGRFLTAEPFSSSSSPLARQPVDESAIYGGVN